MELTAENVNSVAIYCLFADDELSPEQDPPDNAVIVDGIVGQYGFHAERLDERKSEIASLLDGLSDDFKTKGGGGTSFLNAGETRDREHWGEHPAMGMLMALGMASKLCRYSVPKDMWPLLPGGMPYITIDSEALEKAA